MNSTINQAMSEQALAEYRQTIETWRKAREQALAAPDGWLALVGLDLLQNGDYRLGSRDGNDILLPASAPAHLGTLHYRDGTATLRVADGERVSVDGVDVAEVAMVNNVDAPRATLVKVGTITFNLHKFGDEVALRVRDSANPAIQEFTGCVWYPIQPAYRVVGRLVRQSAPSAIAVSTSVRTTAQYQSIGRVEFELLGQPLQLLGSAASNPHELFIILRDATAGKTTYGAGRYLYATVDAADNVTLDFNKLYSPPCAFTPYATCSLPPRENVLTVAIEAGELYDHS